MADPIESDSSWLSDLGANFADWFRDDPDSGPIDTLTKTLRESAQTLTGGAAKSLEDFSGGTKEGIENVTKGIQITGILIGVSVVALVIGAGVFFARGGGFATPGLEVGGK